MSAIIILGIVAFGSSLLAFFSGFGLGTLLLPSFLFFMPLPEAVLSTAVVHLANNLFKFTLLYKDVNFPVLLRFGIPSALAAFLGASLIPNLNGMKAYSYNFNGTLFEIPLLNFCIGLLIIAFVFIDTFSLVRIKEGKNTQVLGGLLSGFFGGLSGHQGALRAAFLIRYGLGKEGFIATGVAISLFVDFSRIPRYLMDNDLDQVTGYGKEILVAIICAFTGAILGKKLLTKITVKSVNIIVSVSLVLIGLAMLMGLFKK